MKKIYIFAHSFTLWDEAKISAKVEDGILTIDLPKIKREEGKTGHNYPI